MTRQSSPVHRFGSKAVFLAAVMGIAGGVVRAAPPDANPMKTRTTAPKGEGLDSLDEPTLAAELSGRNLATLFDYYCKTHSITATERQTITTVGALRQLGMTGPISNADKLKRVKDIADGIDSVLAAVKDPNQAHAVCIDAGGAGGASGREHAGILGVKTRSHKFTLSHSPALS